jgi:hypothetical protein
LEGTPDIIKPKQETDYGGTSDNQFYAYTFVRNVQTAEKPDGVYGLTFTSSNEQAKLSVYGHIGQGDNRLFLGKAPSLRMTRLHGLDGDRNSEAVKYDLPKWIARRESKEGSELVSQFVHVMEPYAHDSQPLIDRVDVLHSDETTMQAVIAVTYGEVTDIIMSAPHYEGGVPLRTGEWELAGKNGFVRIVKGRVQRMLLAGGTRLVAGGHTIDGDGPITGTILDVIGPIPGGGGHRLIVDGDIPPSVVGRYVIIHHPDHTTTAYPIGSVTRSTSTNLLELGVDEDPGFVYTIAANMESGPNRPSRMTYYPGREWVGSHTYVIDNVVTASFPLE